MSQTTSATITAPVALVDFAGHLVKQCAACPALFNAAIPGAVCPEHGGEWTHSGPEWVDVTAQLRAILTAPLTIIEAAHFGVRRPN